MPEEWFEVAYINFDKAILHGRIAAGIDDFRCRRQADVEQVLTDEQREQISHLGAQHHDEMQRLLASFVDRNAALARGEQS